jgi:adenine C2-methylase RlmN of 23S rRNA A2503 and tRNA A37
MNNVRILTSTLDKSVNWITPFKNGSIETRFVQKKSDYIIAYVSSSIGCNLGCKQCFLTQKKQTNMFAVTPTMFADQVKLVTNHYKQLDEINTQNKINRCNINFMARGDAFSNKYIVNDYPSVYREIDNVCKDVNLKTKMNISTIMPYTIRDRKLEDIFKDSGKSTFIYYSLYSMNDIFRKKWMPNAIDWRIALNKLKDYQNSGGNIITFHWAFIEGENDNIKEVEEMAKILKDYEFDAKFNLVRYNNHPNLPNKETNIEKIQDLFNIVNSAFKNNEKSYIVPRLNVDNHIACGLFANDAEL